jgi:hypothetical protein
VSIYVDPWPDFARVRRKPLEFFCQPAKFDCPITAKSCAAIVVRQAQRLRRLGRAAAARSTGLRPIHFIHFIEAAVYRGPNLPEGITQSLQLCNDWQGESFW